MVSRDPCSNVWPLALAHTVEAAVGTGRAFIRAVLVCHRNSPRHHLHRSSTGSLCDQDMPQSAYHRWKHARRQQKHDLDVQQPIEILRTGRRSYAASSDANPAKPRARQIAWNGCQAATRCSSQLDKYLPDRQTFRTYWVRRSSYA